MLWLCLAECLLFGWIQISTGCVSGCMCPDGLLSDGAGGCINETSCPCVHNGEVYLSGETLTVDCNTWFVQCLPKTHIRYTTVLSLTYWNCAFGVCCSYCSGRKFRCTNNVCNGVCGIYGDGHYITFDDKRFDFSGQCEYSLMQVSARKGTKV